ncbi:MAG: helix-turn-helix domain-containing protein [Candidatus Geothermincolia bacterium]
MNKLMTTDEVADLLSVKPATIRKWVHLQEIPVVRLGRSVRFDHETIAAWVREKSVANKKWDN